MKEKISFGKRINTWLYEPEGHTFKDGKWRFWFPMLLGFSLLNAILTANIFGAKAQAFFGSITLAVGALIAWLCIGTLHYSDSSDAKLSKGVSLLDSITLCFVIAHFCFLLWAQGHLMTLQNQEAKYEASAATFNEKAEKISSDNVEIAKAGAQTAREATKAARLRNDTAYQLRRAAETGNVARARIGRGLDVPAPASAVSLAAIELEKPKAPKQSSADFLTRWDAWIRAANFGELILAAITFIFIRNRSARFNSQRAASTSTDEKKGNASDDVFPSEVDATDVNIRGDYNKARFQTATEQTANCDSRRLSPNCAISTDRKAELKALRAHLKAIAFYCPGLWFRADLIDGGVHIRMFRRRRGIEETVASTRQSDKLFAALSRSDFRSRLVEELTRQGFLIEVEAVK